MGPAFLLGGGLEPGQHLGWPASSNVSQETEPPSEPGDVPAPRHCLLRSWGVSSRRSTPQP